VIIDKIIFRELTPDKNPKLFAGDNSSYKCDLFDTYKTNTSDGFALNYSAKLPNKGEFTFICKIENLKDIEFNMTGPFLTYNFQVYANYTYETAKTSGTIWIDTKNYPCVAGRIDKNGWRTHTESDCGWMPDGILGTPNSSLSPKCANLKDFDNIPWYNYTYDDSEWTLVNLPNTGWGTIRGKSSIRFYRKTLFWDGSNDVWLNVTSGDGSACFVSNSGGTHLIFNYTTEYRMPGHRCGAYNEYMCNKTDSNTIDASRCARLIVPGSKSDTDSELYKICQEWTGVLCSKCKPWDYAYKINDKLKVGENMIACQVVNQAYLNIQSFILGQVQEYDVGQNAYFDVHVPRTS
jgi:hypothetical protein